MHIAGLKIDIKKKKEEKSYLYLVSPQNYN